MGISQVLRSAITRIYPQARNDSWTMTATVRKLLPQMLKLISRISVRSRSFKCTFPCSLSHLASDSKLVTVKRVVVSERIRFVVYIDIDSWCQTKIITKPQSHHCCPLPCAAIHSLYILIPRLSLQSLVRRFQIVVPRPQPSPSDLGSLQLQSRYLVPSPHPVQC